MEDGSKTPEELEREDATWWLRRVATTLALANAAGVLALGSIIGDGITIETAAPAIISPLGQFLGGCIAAFLLFVFQTLFAAARVVFGFDRETRRTKRHAVRLVIYVIYFCLFLAGAALSSAYFISGTQIVIEGLRERACTAPTVTVLDRGLPTLYPIPDCPGKP